MKKKLALTVSKPIITIHNYPYPFPKKSLTTQISKKKQLAWIQDQVNVKDCVFILCQPNQIRVFTCTRQESLSFRRFFIASDVVEATSIIGYGNIAIIEDRLELIRSDFIREYKTDTEEELSFYWDYRSNILQVYTKPNPIKPDIKYQSLQCKHIAVYLENN